MPFDGIPWTEPERSDSLAEPGQIDSSGDTRTWTYTYTSTGQLASVTLPRTDVTAETEYAYTSGALTKITDALGYETQILTYISGGLPLTIEDPNGVVTAISYNSRNWMTGSVLATSAGNLTTGYEYDSAGNLTTLTLPDGTETDYSYDSAHRLAMVTNALGETQTFTKMMLHLTRS